MAHQHKIHGRTHRGITPGSHDSAFSPKDPASEESAAPPAAIAHDATPSALRLPPVVWTTDLELRFTSSSGGVRQAFGRDSHQLHGLSLKDYFRTSDPQFPPIAAHRRALAGEHVRFTTGWAGRSLQNSIEPLRNEHGEIIGTLGMALDATDVAGDGASASADLNFTQPASKANTAIGEA